MIVVEYRRTLWSEQSLFRTFEPGVTLAQIAECFDDQPPEFAEFGAMQMAHADGSFASEVPRALWGKVRPKDGIAIFVSCKPQFGGDNGGIFQIIAAIALVALVSWVSAGGLAFLAPSLLGAGTVGASVAAAAIGVAGQAALSLLSAPTAGQAGGGTQALANAGVSANALGGFQQIPAVLGTMRVSPPFLTRPYTTLDNTVPTVRGVLGLCGPLAISDIQVNGTDATDLPDFSYELLEGWPDDPLNSIVDLQAFEENINLQMSEPRLKDDQHTLIEPHTESYPKPHLFKTCRDCDVFRFMLHFPGGLFRRKEDSGDLENARALFRIRIRNRAGGSWVNLPELVMSASRETPYRCEIRLRWSTAEDGTSTGWKDGDTGTRWAYYSNKEWEADSYFYPGGATFPSVNPLSENVVATQGDFNIFLDPDVFPIGQYDVEITRGGLAGSGVATDSYDGGYFTYASFDSPDYIARGQDRFSGTTIIQNYASFRFKDPILERGLAQIAFQARGLQVQSISAIFKSYVPVWNGTDWDTVAPSNNPAALLRWVLTGGLNARPIPDGILDTLGDFYDHCVAEGLTCNALITEGSVEQAATLAAQCGDAILRRSDKWGVVIDRDRSEEAVVGMFGPHNMTEPLTLTKAYLTGSRGLIPSFYDEANDYAVSEFNEPIYDDGLPSNDTTLVEGAVYDGLTSERLVRRRARMDLRRARLRSTRYSWGVHQEQLNNRKGDLVGVAHDVLINSYATGRVKSFSSSSGGGLLTVTLNTEIADAPVVDAESLFDVDDVLLLADVFTLEGPEIGMQIRLKDGSVIMVPVSGVSGATLSVQGQLAVPSKLVAGCLVSVGPRTRETRRVIIADIRPGEDLTATIEAVDEAPGIFADLGQSVPVDHLGWEDYAPGISIGALVEVPCDVFEWEDVPPEQEKSYVPLPTEELDWQDHAPAIKAGATILVPTDAVTWSDVSPLVPSTDSDFGDDFNEDFGGESD